MPMLFDFTCSECGETKEYLVRNSESQPEECSECKSKEGFKKEVCFNAGGFYGLPMSTPRSHTNTWNEQKS